MTSLNGHLVRIDKLPIFIRHLRGHDLYRFPLKQYLLFILSKCQYTFIHLRDIPHHLKLIIFHNRRIYNLELFFPDFLFQIHDLSIPVLPCSRNRVSLFPVTSHNEQKHGT